VELAPHVSPAGGLFDALAKLDEVEFNQSGYAVESCDFSTYFA
jgi:hypothetical protein